MAAIWGGGTCTFYAPPSIDATTENRLAVEHAAMNSPTTGKSRLAGTRNLACQIADENKKLIAAAMFLADWTLPTAPSNR